MSTWIKLDTIDYGRMLVKKESIFSINDCVIKGKSGVGFQEPDVYGCVVTLVDGSGRIIPDKIIVKETTMTIYRKQQSE